MSFETFIALRYLKSKKAYRFLSFLSLISLTGICISVFSFTVIHSVMNGFSTHLREALVGFDAHLTIQEPGARRQEAGGGNSVESWLRARKEVASPRVASVVPVTEFAGILETPYRVAGGGKIRGLAPEDLAREPHLDVFFFGDEKFSDLENSDDLLPGILIGEELYSRLRFLPGDEETVTVIYPFGDVGPSGEIEPHRRDFRVLGVFNTGFYDYDTQYAFIGKKEAELLAGGGRLQGDSWTQILVRLKDMQNARAFRDKFTQAFPGVSVATWEERNRRLFSALKLERAGMILLLSIVTFIASFNVFGLLTLLALTKTRDMSLFYALGLSRWKMQSVYRRVGIFLGLFGSAFGLGAGLIVVYLLKTWPLPLPPAYYLSVLPAKIDMLFLAAGFALVPLFSMIAAWGPAWQASKLNPMEILRVT